MFSKEDGYIIKEFTKDDIIPPGSIFLFHETISHGEVGLKLRRPKFIFWWAVPKINE